METIKTRGVAIPCLGFGTFRMPVVIPRARRPESQKANLDALGIALDDKDRAAIAALPKDQRFVRPHFAPEWDAVV